MKKNFIFLLLFGVTLYSCTTDNLERHEMNVAKQEAIFVSKIDTSTTVDIKKVEYISKHFQNHINQTRAALYEKEIKAIEALKDEKGKELLYIVNYKDNQGFVIISATQNYMPILAHGDYGNFKLEEIKETGAALWLNQQKRIIESVNELPDSTQQAFRNLWNDYNIQKEKIVMTRSYDNVISLINDSIYAWQQRGYNVFRYADIRDTQFFNDMPMGVKTEVHNAVDSADPRYGGRDKVTFILTKSKKDFDFQNPLLETHWGQTDGFAQYTPQNSPAGCVAVAMGQIMKHHEYPKRYSWNLMQNDYATPTTAEFLYEIGQKVNMKYGANGSKANIDDALSAFKGYYGYFSAKKITHNYSNVLDELRAKRPVYMRGYDSSGFLGIVIEGHAWVCDGYYSSMSRDEYTIFILEDTYDGTEPTELSYIYKEEGPILTASLRFHMNWGWNNKHDGFYSDNNLWIHDETEGDLNFAHGRYDIINLHPTY